MLTTAMMTILVHISNYLTFLFMHERKVALQIGNLDYPHCNDVFSSLGHPLYFLCLPSSDRPRFSRKKKVMKKAMTCLTGLSA